MIVITGAAGFIGSNLAALLIKENFTDIVLVDDFSVNDKENNFIDKYVTERVFRDDFPAWLDENNRFVQFVFHLGARTNTAEFDFNVLNKLNTEYSKTIWLKCCDYGLPLVYASSAATYGSGENGFDDTTNPEILKPLNPYGVSKNEFDKWVLKQERKPFFWVGLKFFNVYGPNEYHKNRMASVIFHAYNQIQANGKLNLFRSHLTDFADGEQKRDFVYVKDVCKVMYFFMLNRKNNGIYNLGTGQARTFNDLGKSVFRAMEIEEKIDYIDIPEDIREKYQYFTEADMTNLRSIGYTESFYSLEEGIEDYVKNYLNGGKYE
ncbi:MAG: ADP-glyceromanno-heptose 6-epimerase [Bacteroidales bacterium]|nr:ADP-glyceromanno-heptose 6-epimerase [Bacteroidales bacterium]